MKRFALSNEKTIIYKDKQELLVFLVFFQKHENSEINKK